MTGIILAGGKSSRMGEDKGLILFNDKPLIQYAIDLLKSMNVNHLIIVANNEDYSQFPHEIVKDEFKEKGPLSGIYSGLKRSNDELNIILPCDVPNLHKLVIEKLLKEHNSSTLNSKSKVKISLARNKNKTHSVIGIYNRDVIDDLKESIELDELRVLSFALRAGMQEIKMDSYLIPDNCFKNYNSKEDFK